MINDPPVGWYKDPPALEDCTVYWHKDLDLGIRSDVKNVPWSIYEDHWEFTPLESTNGPDACLEALKIHFERLHNQHMIAANALIDMQEERAK